MYLHHKECIWDFLLVGLHIIIGTVYMWDISVAIVALDTLPLMADILHMKDWTGDIHGNI